MGLTMNKNNKGHGRIQTLGITLIVLPFFAPLLVILVFAGNVISDDVNSPSVRATTLLTLRSEGDDHPLIRRQVSAFNQADAVGNGGHDRVQAIAESQRSAGAPSWESD